MSDGEVKRFSLVTDIVGGDEWTGLRRHAEGYYMSYADHERIVDELKSQLEHSETKVTWLLRDNERVSKQKDLVIEALKVIDRDFAWHYDECTGAIDDDEFCDCGLYKVRSEIKAIEKGEA